MTSTRNTLRLDPIFRDNSIVIGQGNRALEVRAENGAGREAPPHHRARRLSAATGIGNRSPTLAGVTTPAGNEFPTGSIAEPQIKWRDGGGLLLV